MSLLAPGSASPRWLPAAVSPLSAGLVHGPRRGATVLGCYRYGVYLGVGADRVLPVLSADAVPLPTALRVAAGPSGLGWAVVAGDVVEVGGGAVRLPGVEVRAVRSWRPARVLTPAAGPWPPDPPVADAVRRLLEDAAGPSSAWLIAPVRAAVSAPQPATAVAGLVGRGGGLTPAGDDALAGALLLLAATGTPSGPLATAVRDRSAATTAVSAALLEAASTGHAAPAVVALVDAVAAGRPADVAPALGPVLGIGHTSGRDLVAGLAGALPVLASSGRIAA